MECAADLTHVWTIAGFCYTSFIVDVYSRRIVGWRVAASMRTDLALDAFEMAIFARGQELLGLIHHSDRRAKSGHHSQTTSTMRPSRRTGSRTEYCG